MEIRRESSSHLRNWENIQVEVAMVTPFEDHKLEDGSMKRRHSENCEQHIHGVSIVDIRRLPAHD